MNDTTYTFAVDIVNPSIAQTQPVISVMASGSSVFSRSNMTSPNTAAKNVPNGANALYITMPEFVVRRVSQRTCMAGASNLLSITLKTNMPLEHTGHCSPTIIITPLTGVYVCVRLYECAPFVRLCERAIDCKWMKPRNTQAQRPRAR